MAGNYKIGSGVPKTKDSPGVGAGLNLSRFRKPPARSNDSSPTGPAYQPFPSKAGISGTGGVMSTLASDGGLGSFKSPVKSALASRKFKPSGKGGKASPSSMIGGKASNVRPTGGEY